MVRHVTNIKTRRSVPVSIDNDKIGLHKTFGAQHAVCNGELCEPRCRNSFRNLYVQKALHFVSKRLGAKGPVI